MDPAWVRGADIQAELRAAYSPAASPGGPAPKRPRPSPGPDNRFHVAGFGERRVQVVSRYVK